MVTLLRAKTKGITYHHQWGRVKPCYHNHMNKLILIVLFILPSNLLSQSDITDPTISLRCKELINARRSKVTHKLRIKELLDRNFRLQSITPTERISIREKLGHNFQRLEKELELTNLKIQKQEETIIRQGCPGINI